MGDRLYIGLEMWVDKLQHLFNPVSIKPKGSYCRTHGPDGAATGAV